MSVTVDITTSTAAAPTRAPDLANLLRIVRESWDRTRRGDSWSDPERLAVEGARMQHAATVAAFGDAERGELWTIVARLAVREAHLWLKACRTEDRAAELADAHRRALIATEISCSLLECELATLAVAGDGVAYARAAGNLGHRYGDIARDIHGIGLAPDDAARYALRAGTRSAQLHLAATRHFVAGDSSMSVPLLTRALDLVYAATAFDHAAREATFLGQTREAHELVVRGATAARRAAAMFLDLPGEPTRPMARITNLGRAAGSANHAATLLERAGAIHDAFPVRDWALGIEQRRQGAIAAARAAAMVTDRELIEVWTADAARILNGVRFRGMASPATASRINCQRVVIAGLAWSSGAVLAAPSWTPGSYEERELFPIYEQLYQTRLDVGIAPKDIAARLTAVGPGAKGIVHLRRPDGNNHVLVAENVGGDVYFLDYQDGTVSTLSATGEDLSRYIGGQVRYGFMLTHNPAFPRTANQERILAERALAAIDANTRLYGTAHQAARATAGSVVYGGR